MMMHWSSCRNVDGGWEEKRKKDCSRLCRPFALNLHPRSLLGAGSMVAALDCLETKAPISFSQQCYWKESLKEGDRWKLGFGWPFQVLRLLLLFHRHLGKDAHRNREQTDIGFVVFWCM